MTDQRRVAEAGAEAAGFTVTWEYGALPLAEFERAVWARGALRLLVLPVLAWGGAGLVALGAAFGVEALAGPRHAGAAGFVLMGAALGAVLLFATFLLRWRVSMAARRRAEARTGYRAGLTRVSLGAAGVRVVSDHVDARYGWPAVAGVAQTRRGMVLLLGTDAGIYLPDAGLPPGLLREAALDRIHGWMNG